MNEIKNKDTFREYYIGIFIGLKSTGRTYFAEEGTYEAKANAVINSGYWNVKSIPGQLAKIIDENGYLNVGICPLCGDPSIGSGNSWPYAWTYRNGPELCICKDCYEKGMKEQTVRQQSKKGCYIATVCYGDENSNEVLLLKWYRDTVLSQNIFGKGFIKVYYFFSPSVAKFLLNKKNINEIIKTRFLNPIVKRLNRKYK